MSEFTKGKWEKVGNCLVAIVNHETTSFRVICECELSIIPERMKEIAANTRLIAAAPEMYELLNSMYAYIKEVECVPEYFPNALSLWAEQGKRLIDRIDGSEAQS